MSYTKGEWEVIEYTTDAEVHVSGNGYFIANCGHTGRDERLPYNPNAIANAHLIAAAPDMAQSGVELDKAIGEAIIKIAQATKLSNALIQIIQETVLPAQENWRKALAKVERREE